MLKWLQGKKSYLLAIGATISAVGAFASGQITLFELAASLFGAGGLASVRHAVSTETKGK